jgi:hypothetical protein
MQAQDNFCVTGDFAFLQHRKRVLNDWQNWCQHTSTHHCQYHSRPDISKAGLVFEKRLKRILRSIFKKRVF